MKKLNLFFFFILTFGVLQAQQDIKKEVLFAIPENEEIVFGESRFVIGCDAKEQCIVTRSQGQFFTYQNGLKTGTFSTLADAYQPCKSITEKNTEYSLVVDVNLFTDQRYCSIDENGMAWIKFKGSKIGPYKQIMGLFVSPDKQNYHALVRKADFSQAMISNLHPPISVEGNFVSMFMSTTGKSFMVCTTNGLDLMTEMIKINELGLSDDEYQKKLIELTQQISSQTAPVELTVYLSDGHKFGGYVKDNINSGSPAFCKTSDEHWMMMINNKLLIDGKEVEDFKDNWIALSDVWVFPDGKSYGYKTYDKLIFNNGKIFDYPLFLDFCESENSLSWLILENKNTFTKFSLKIK